MYAKVICCAIHGVNGIKTYVEADSSNGFPSFVMVGNLSSSVKEAGDRVKTALNNFDISLPTKKVTINIAPADIRKEGTSYDLPICIAILKSLEVIKNDVIDEYAFIGELNLQGDVVGVNGILPMVSHLKSEGVKGVFVPKKNEQEALLVDDIDIISVSNVKEIIDALSIDDAINIDRPKIINDNKNIDNDIDKVDFSDISGQHLLKRAVEVAVAGRHNIIISGPAGTGKTMIAKRIPTIMPDLTKDEAIEITKIYSIAGKLENGRIIKNRPFRSPHHSTTVTSLIGGGIYPMPGDISLASGGVLFLDELPLFSTMCLENLREPVEEKEICISRLKGSYKYPANFMLVASMNLCPCSYYPDRNKCNCTDAEIKRYQRGVSRPLLERIDICAESSPIDFSDLTKEEKSEPSIVIKERILKARKIQENRYKKYSSINYNADLDTKLIKKYCKIDDDEKEYLRKIYKVKRLSARTYNKLLKVARTIADLDNSENIQKKHLVEASNYRGIEDRWLK